ncbi:MAG: 16S rRNA processing protein RimM [Bacteroidetes bacterium]|nr:16S rRNA processing protein RimM [Bacteroidota bacterium]
MKTLSKEDLTRIGVINKSHGYKGVVHCITDLSSPTALKKAKYLFILINGLPVPFLVEDMQVYGNEFHAKLEDVNSDADAKKITGLDIYALKIKEKKKSRFLTWTDLAGFTAEDENYGELSEIVEVAEYPMQYIARCIVGEREVLFPLNEDVILDIDEENKRIYLNLPEGLLDIYLGDSGEEEKDADEEEE